MQRNLESALRDVRAIVAEGGAIADALRRELALAVARVAPYSDQGRIELPPRK